MKLHQGNIYRWKMVFFNKENYPDLPDNLGFVVEGFRTEIPQFGTAFRTSAVVRYDTDTMEVETLNSRYQLVGHGRE